MGGVSGQGRILLFQRKKNAMDTASKTDDALQSLESARKKLLARGATGIGLFVHKSCDTSQREYARELVEYLALMTKETTGVPASDRL
jgi:hypothetical protein